jgi:hypothetical protein
MNSRLQFWQRSDSWPRDTSHFVFFGRAVHLFGEAMFSHRWTGDEPIADLLARRSSCTGNEEKYPSSVKLDAATILPDSEFVLALERFRCVQNEIATRAEAAKLITAFRSKIGGEMEQIPRVWWSTERLTERFAHCHIDPADPFGTGKWGGSYSWIFVARSTVKQTISILIEENRMIQGSNQRETGVTVVQAGTERKEVEKRYLARVKSYEGKTPPTRAEDEAFCREKLGVSRFRTRELRKQLAPASWQRAGPKKKPRE